MTWKIESFTDVGGNKDQEFVKFIDLPSRTPTVRAGRQRPAGAAARARLGHGRRDGRVARCGIPRRSSSARGPSSAWPSTPTSATDRAGSAIARSAISRRGVRRSCRTRAGARICRRAKDCCAFSNARRRSTASIGSTATDAARRAAPSRSPASTSTPARRAAVELPRRSHAA